MNTKYTEGKMREAGKGKVDAGSAGGDKQIPPNIGRGGGGSGKFDGSSQTGSKKQIPPMDANPKSGPPIAD